MTAHTPGSVHRQTASVYFAPTAKRRFFTRQAAAHAEASAMIRRKYPTQQADYDDAGRCTDPGFHWSSDERLCRLHKRLARRIAAISKAGSAS